MALKQIYFTITITLLTFQSLIEARKPIVTTTLGQIKGKQNRYNGMLYEEYVGIPFAEPPRRWEKSHPVKPWAPTILDATKFSPHCTQFISILYPFVGMGKETSEDCLYLNIWVPNGVQENKGRKLPVMFWIYGGGYLLGTGEMYPGHALALYGDVIVVNFNYRVSTLGWLSTGDSVIPGNYGLWDTKTALDWVHTHIEAFGGDVNKITVFGQSAGAAISGHIMLSSQTNKLVTNVIAMSGSASGYFGLSKQPLKLAMLLANVFNCSAKSSSDIEVCLKKVDAETLDFWGATVQKKYVHQNPTLLPVLDGDFIKKLPKESFMDGDGKHINFISGFLYDDAAAFVLENPIGFPKLKEKNNSATSNESLWEHMRQWYGFLNNTDDILKEIVKEYPDLDTNDSQERAMAATNAFTDAWFAASSNWEGSLHASFNVGANYQYQFKHRQTFLIGYPEWVTGSHMDDVYSIFGQPYLSLYRKLYLRKDFKKEDTVVNEHVMSYFTNFAHTGNPNKGSHTVPVHWIQYNETQKNYLEISQIPIERTFHANNIFEKYEFQIDLPNRYVYPDPPSFEDSFNKVTISEKEIENSVQQMRQSLISLSSNEYFVEKVDRFIDKFKQKRKMFINLN